jgi:hypothetical protein
MRRNISSLLKRRDFVIGKGFLIGKGLLSSKSLAAAALGMAIGMAGTLLLAPITAGARDDGVFEVMRADQQQRRGANPPPLYRDQHMVRSAPVTFFSWSRSKPRPPVDIQPDVSKPASSPQSMQAYAPSAPSRSDAIFKAAASGMQEHNALRRKIIVRTVAASEKLAAYEPGFNRRTVCVRMCDGYHFPIGDLNSTGDLKVHESACQASCPGAPVKLFTLASGQDNIDDAISAGGKPYKNMPMAYAHQRASDPMCTCQSASRDVRVSLLKDFTLRKGDTVVLNGRAKVFKGAKQWPYRPRDFADLKGSKNINKADRRKIDDMVGISRREAAERAVRTSRRIREARAIGLSDLTLNDAAPMTVLSSASGVRIVAPSITGSR